MEKLILTIDNSTNTNLLINFFKSINYIKQIKHIEEKVETISKFKSEKDFISICGIWRGRDITKESLRNKSWRKR